MRSDTAAILADVIPRYLAPEHARQGNPWGIASGTLAAYNKANGTSYGDADLAPYGRAIAVWLLLLIDDALARAGAAKGRSPRPVDVVTGYLAGWAEIVKAYRGESYTPPSRRALDAAAAIVREASKQSGPAVPALEDPPLEPIPSRRKPDVRTSAAKAYRFFGGNKGKQVLWAVASIATFPLVMWAQRRKR